MPERPAQHDVRSWFEEPNRSRQGATAGVNEDPQGGGDEPTEAARSAATGDTTGEPAPAAGQRATAQPEPSDTSATPGAAGTARQHGRDRADGSAEPPRGERSGRDEPTGETSDTEADDAAERGQAERGQARHGRDEREKAVGERDDEPADDRAHDDADDQSANADSTTVVVPVPGAAGGDARRSDAARGEATTRDRETGDAAGRETAGRETGGRDAPGAGGQDPASSEATLPVWRSQPPSSGTAEDTSTHAPDDQKRETQARDAQTQGTRGADRPDDEAEITEVIPAVPAHLPYPPSAPRSGGPPGAPPDDRSGSEADAVTAEIPRIRESAPSDADWPTVDLARPQPREPGAKQPLSDRTRLVRAGIVAASLVGLLTLLYGLDLAMSRGEVPRGVTVAGVDVGGLTPATAEQRLREQIEPRLNRPLALQAGDVEVTLEPGPAGLTLDWSATLDQAGEQPLNPWTRLVSLFTTREVGVVTSGDRGMVTKALEQLAPQVDREPVEGTIRFEGARPVVVDPVVGQRLDVVAATDVVLEEWARGGKLEIPVISLPVTTTPEGIREALHTVVEPAVSAPVQVVGEGANAVLKPEHIAAALRFEPNGQGGLTVTVDHPTVVDALSPQLADTEEPGNDATFRIQNGVPVVVPSTEGRGIDWDKSLTPLFDVLRASGPERTLTAVYVAKPPKLTTEQAYRLGITTKVSSFTTGGFASDSGRNIRRVAEQVNGAVVKPGETFSLNGHTGPRNAASGYVEAGIIEHGRPSRGIGGGVSQFATTLYNAAYFAGMVDVEHREHSYYISRYPAGREATVYEGAIDVKFRNDQPTGIFIQTAWTPTSVTVTFWGTKHVEVESITGPRTNPTNPETVVVRGEPCSPSQGSQGFTVTNTRVVRDARSGAEISRKTRTVVYHPQPRVVCEKSPAAPG